MLLQQSFLMAYILFFSILAGFLIVQTAGADKVTKVKLSPNIQVTIDTKRRLDDCGIDVTSAANIKNTAGKRLGFGRRRRASGSYKGPNLPLEAQGWLADKVVPYEISDEFTSEQRSTILSAMKEFQDKTCIRFKERTDKTDTKYVNIVPYSDNCGRCDCDYWGEEARVRPPNKDLMIIQDCVEFGYVLHRLMHAVGYDDEHKRHDRDSWIDIDESNIKASDMPNFNKYSSLYEHSATGYPYDYASIMHQGPYWLSENPNSQTGQTIRKNSKVYIYDGLNKMGQRTGFSEQDLIRINNQWCDGAGVPEPPEVKTDNPMLKAGKFEGDINGISDKDFDLNDDGILILSNAARKGWQKWPNCVVPYKISDDFTDDERQSIAKAFKAYHDNTCIQFKPRKDEEDYLYFNAVKKGCSSDWGLRGMGRQYVNLSRDDGCIYAGIVMHELMHTVGFVHEQSRDDRDNYVDILWDNIEDICDSYKQFLRFSSKDIDHLGAPYDYDSVLHYGVTDFSLSLARNSEDPDPLKTIRGTKSGGDKMGQRTHLSQIDIWKINKLYEKECKCDKKATNTGSAQGTKQTTTKSGGGKQITTKGQGEKQTTIKSQGEKQTTRSAQGAKQTTPIPQIPGVDQTQRPGGIGFALGAGGPGGININVQVNGNKKPSKKRPGKKTTTISPEEEVTTEPPGGKNSKKCINMPNFDSICRTLKSNSVKCKKDLARVLCPKTCGNCKFSLGTCKDTANKKTCSPLPKNKKCDKEPGLSKCRKTCGHCLQSINGSVKPGPKCQDKTNLPFKCADLKKKNFCKTLKNVAMETCPKTCSLCKGKKQQQQ